jgi:hypothetical protein
VPTTTHPRTRPRSTPPPRRAAAVLGADMCGRRPNWSAFHP